MDSDPLLSLAEDSRTFGSCHKRVPKRSTILSNEEILAKAALHFKTALENAKKQIIYSQELSLDLAKDSRKKDLQIAAEIRTTHSLMQVHLWILIKGWLLLINQFFAVFDVEN
jgi:hypothetical protein